MARPRKSDAGDRPVMDMGGTQPDAAAKAAAKTFLDEAADQDRGDAQTRHANKGLRQAKEHVQTLAKHCASALASDSMTIKLALLDEIADLGAAIRDGCRAASRDAKKETRNLQE